MLISSRLTEFTAKLLEYPVVSDPDGFAAAIGQVAGRVQFESTSEGCVSRADAVRIRQQYAEKERIEAVKPVRKLTLQLA